MHPNEVNKHCLFISFRNWRGFLWILFSVCHLLRLGVSSIFGPQQSNSISNHVQSICDTMEIPHLEVRWDYRTRRESCLVNLYPHPSVLSRVIRLDFSLKKDSSKSFVSQAYVDIVEAWGWKTFTIIYETNDGLLRLQELLKAHRRTEFPTTVRQLPDTNDYRYD